VKIDGTGSGADVIRVYKAQEKKDHVAVKQGAECKTDTLEISSEAKKMQCYRNLLRNLPEVREELVASLQERIRDGAYRPEGKRIAAGILEERRLDRRI